jgi:hypothetical protein
MGTMIDRMLEKKSQQNKDREVTQEAIYSLIKKEFR